ncbi:hypothetical protein [Nocardia carnea]|uniref:hypothetical protein n=1 Tax=Nocardia carnea TaxID=37328 RepID=UPI0024588B20|nr:hypothetical protein [Nocardia carnea]
MNSTWAHALEQHARSAEREAELEYWRTVAGTADPLLTERALDPAVAPEPGGPHPGEGEPSRHG